MRRAHTSPRRVNPPEIRKSNLPTAWRDLLDLCFRIGFGSVHDVPIVGGLPVIAAGTTVVRTIKLACDNSSRLPDVTADFAVRREVLELVAHAQRIGDGAIERLDVVAGLPKVIQISGPLAEVMGV